MTPFDSISKGDWLLITSGPKSRTGGGPFSEAVEVEDKTYVGAICRVLAVSFPMVFAQVWPVPCGDPTHNHRPFNVAVKYGEIGLEHCAPSYVREYRRRLRQEGLR
jgi:hypothetical protein